MNIAIVSEGFTRRSLLLQPWHRIYAISKRLARKEDLSLLLISNKTSNSLETEDIDGIKIVRLTQFPFSIIGKKTFTKVLIEYKIDVVIWCGTPLSAFYLNQMKGMGIPIIWDIDVDLPIGRSLKNLSFRELFHPDHNNLFSQIVAMIFTKKIFKTMANSALIDKIVVPSESIKGSLSRLGVDLPKIEVISSAIETTNTNQLTIGEEDKIRNGLGFKKTDFIVTYFGSPCTMRGTDTAILSMKKILSVNSNVKMLLLSRRETDKTLVVNRHFQSEEFCLLKRIREVGAENNIRIVPGIMSRTELRNHLLMSDAIILPFKHVFSEPPLSVIEAMSLGKVVVTTRLPTLSELIGNDRGILVEPNNTHSLAQAILFLEANPQKAMQIGERARHFVADLYDWDDITSNFEELLRKTAFIRDDCD